MNQKTVALLNGITMVAILLALAACSTGSQAGPVNGTPPANTLPAQTAPATPTIGPGPTKAPTSEPEQLTAERITFQRAGMTLVGYLYKPAGDGPFPGVIWNHGSEQDPTPQGEFLAVAQILVPAGYAVFAPEREGQGESQGPYIQDQIKAELQKNGQKAASQLFIQLMEGPQLDDQLAGEAVLAGLPYVDKNRLAVVGCSYGGIQTLLAAERGAGFKAAVAISPGAESWQANPLLQQRLLQAVDNIDIPVFLLHPAKDASVLPGFVLGQEFAKLGKPFQLEIYAPYGRPDQQVHCFGAKNGYSIWGPEVLRFLANFDK